MLLLNTGPNGPTTPCNMQRSDQKMSILQLQENSATQVLNIQQQAHIKGGDGEETPPDSENSGIVTDDIFDI